MKALANERAVNNAVVLMDDFAKKTGLTDPGRGTGERYLWTDALAVQTFFGLHRLTGKEHYEILAVNLIHEVHEKLGKFHKDDHRSGWISGLSEEKGRQHPTVGGLRIGKGLEERSAEDPYDEIKEWKRDGQYFHYITRWINALLIAGRETGAPEYSSWAAELCGVAKKFIAKKDGQIHLYWKMSIDLSRPLVPSMGAHDPLEGLLCTLSTLQQFPDASEEYSGLLSDFKSLCSGMNWSTADPLGLGGLLLNVVRATDLDQELELPNSVKPEKLMDNSLESVRLFSQMHTTEESPLRRLAFRECGLSLGLRTIWGFSEKLHQRGLKIKQLEPYMLLADSIEEFWLDPSNRTAATWTEHEDINAVSLSASLVAREVPEVFGTR